ncbi:MAG: hypothetical protein H7196_04275, partial [candidate division SR1 bacterium]|nr:hypothetical protein [candidate division SR1 bacterium]
NIKWQFNPNYCVSAGNSSGSNFGLIVPCSGDLRQRFKFSSAITQTTGYEFWIVGKATGNGQAVNWDNTTDVGHNTTALVKFTKTFNNGVFIGQQYSSAKPDIRTYSYWPSPGSRSDNDNDKNIYFYYL